MHLADAFIQSDLRYSGYTYFCHYIYLFIYLPQIRHAEKKGHHGTLFDFVTMDFIGHILEPERWQLLDSSS